MLEKQDFIQRYDELMSFTDFSLYSAPSYSLPEPAFGPSADILQLKLLRIIELVKYNDFTYATNELIALINFHKRVLEQTPYMAPKIISMIELEMVLETSAYLMSKTTPENISLWQNVIDAIAPLNNNQLSMRQQFIHEFVAQVNALEKIDITQYDESLPATVNFLPIKILYKKNKTINMLYQWMTSQAGLISLSSSNQIVKRNKLSMDDILKFDYQNPIGSMLAKDMAPKLLNLESFLYQIETKQQMIKHLYLAKNKTNASQQEYISPYTQKPAYISDHSFCVSTDESIQNDICLSAF